MNDMEISRNGMIVERLLCLPYCSTIVYSAAKREKYATDKVFFGQGIFRTYYDRKTGTFFDSYCIFNSYKPEQSL